MTSLQVFKEKLFKTLIKIKIKIESRLYCIFFLPKFPFRTASEPSLQASGHRGKVPSAQGGFTRGVDPSAQIHVGRFPQIIEISIEGEDFCVLYSVFSC